MTCSENISLQEYADSANQKFSESESRLSQIEGSFETRMNGHTPGSLVCGMLGTGCWIVASCAFFWYIRMYRGVDRTLTLIFLGVALALGVALLIDEIISYFYYGKMWVYQNTITQLKNRVSVGQSAITSNQDAFMKFRVNGWRHPLSVGSSIFEEAASIESTVNGMKSLKHGSICTLKNVLYFTFVIVVTAIGSLSSFGIAADISIAINGGSWGSEMFRAFCSIGVLITEVCIVILAKMWWSHMDCSVTNITLLVAPLGPVLFLLLVAAVLLLVVAVQIIIVVAGIAAAVGAASGG